MEPVRESKEQFEELGPLLEEMEEYLFKLLPACQELSSRLHEVDKSQQLERLTQVMDGLNFYQKLLKSAAVLLSIDFSEPLFEERSVSVLLNELCQIFSNIFEAASNEDFSLLTDIIEYDLIPAIAISQGVLVVVRRRCEERVI